MQVRAAEKIFTWARHNSNALRLFYRDNFQTVRNCSRFQIKLFVRLFSLRISHRAKNEATRNTPLTNRTLSCQRLWVLSYNAHM
jgi:hypothetical protein